MDPSLIRSMRLHSQAGRIVPKLQSIDYINDRLRAQASSAYNPGAGKQVIPSEGEEVNEKPKVKRSKAKSFEEIGDLDKYLDQFRYKDTKKYCYCQKNPHHPMIGCDDEECVYQWFHYYCADLRPWALPKDKWYCPDCRKKSKWSLYRAHGFTPGGLLFPLQGCISLNSLSSIKSSTKVVAIPKELFPPSQLLPSQ